MLMPELLRHDYKWQGYAFTYDFLKNHVLLIKFLRAYTQTFKDKSLFHDKNCNLSLPL